MIFLMIGLLFLVGCPEGEDEVEQVESVFIEGTQGLVASFEPFGFQEEGVSTIYETDTFPIELSLQNKGEEPLEPGEVKVTLKGINLEDFENIPTDTLTNTERIEPISEFNPEGGEALMDFTPNENARYKYEVTGFYKPDIFATIEYQYRTRVIAPKICFKEDLSDPSVCTVREEKNYFVSAAPITVTSLTEDVRGRGIIDLAFVISNVGGGRSTKIGDTFDSRYDKVAYQIVSNPENWECRSAGLENEARLVDGQATVHCFLKEPLDEGELYTRQVELEISYLYRQVIQESLRIKESAT